MTAHRETRFVHAPPDVLFALVADVERYPEFLPMWKWARVLEHEESAYVTEQEIGAGPIREAFRTRTVLQPPKEIEITSADPLFRKFLIHWRFEDGGAGNCRVTISLDWLMQSKVLQKAIDLILPTTARSMIKAFEERATTDRRATH